MVAAAVRAQLDVSAAAKTSRTAAQGGPATQLVED